MYTKDALYKMKLVVYFYIMKILIITCKWIFFLCVIAFGLKSLKEPDIWWMLRTGEWIVNYGEVISKDFFSFTFYGTEWINVKWLFEVILFKVQQIGGAEFTAIIQCIVYALTFWIIEKRSNILITSLDVNLNYKLITILVGVLTLLGIEYRMIGRPEMMSHLMMVAFLFLIEKYRREKSNCILLLIPLQMLWTNIHEAYGIGLVILIVTIVGEFMDSIFHKRNIDTRFIAVCILSILAISINPKGIQMIVHPLEIFGQVDQNKYTIELVGFNDALFWRKEAFLLLLFFILGIHAWWIKSSELGNSIFMRIRSSGFTWLILFCLFFYLGFTAYRNIPFFLLYTAPIITWYFSYLFQDFKDQILKNSVIILAIFLCVFYCGIVTDTYYKIADRSEHYGLTVDGNNNPIGVADFVSKLELKGNAFSDYLTSSYLLWGLRPNFQTYIDLRDLDVFSKPFFENYLKISSDGDLFAVEDKKYDFSYAIVYAAQFEAVHHYLDRNKNWEMVYADPVAVLYLKRTPENVPIIDSLFSVQVGTVFRAPPPPQMSEIARSITLLFNPFYTNEYFDQKIDYDFIGSSFFDRIRDYNAALYQCKASIKKRGEHQYNLELLGKIYIDFSQVVSDENAINNLLSNAKETYTKLITMFPNVSSGYKGLGMYYSIIGNYQEALTFFKRSNEIDFDAEVDTYISQIEQSM